MTTKAAIGTKLRTARTRQVPRLRQQDVDDIVGVPHGRTAHYENGRAAAPHGYLVKLSGTWNIPIGWFLGLDGDELPSPSVHGKANVGIGLIDLYPDLPIGDWDGAITDKVEVDSKFVRTGAFACRIVSNILAPKILHRDVLIFWLTNKPELGVISLAKPEDAPPRLVLPSYNAQTGAIELHGPGVGQPVVGVSEVTAAVVGVVRVLPDGDTQTLANFSGVRLS
ncbi:MAG: helix-turn-helix domain-containing protein [Fimbriimonadaceae bacterium]